LQHLQSPLSLFLVDTFLHAGRFLIGAVGESAVGAGEAFIENREFGSLPLLA
jgi:hypothetical protein